ncbi:hypothetical protein M378DRAFT_160224 [Amanita muscaria Koide BX008]|uniref:Uncharacterized protein n=1 Tax=Amanita muscaria (strain Koide BX008) TaxID=946122 RepID=A0A0C2WY55_AMAMK|nr:hypothetical protein M378DRAFT_160224 [Amanita muscaria Koide BX008]
MTEFWLTYHFFSRSHLQPTTQLIELERLDHKLADLEDVLDYVFRQGYVDAKHRPATWWEKKCGAKVKSSVAIEYLLTEGVGKCPETALRLFIEDIPSTLWFSYVFLNHPHSQVVVQRVKLAGVEARFERLAHVTNHVFSQKFLPCKYRSVVHWECSGRKPINEFTLINDILATGQGVSEDKPVHLVIDDKLIHPNTPCSETSSTVCSPVSTPVCFSAKHLHF